MNYNVHDVSWDAERTQWLRFRQDGTGKKIIRVPSKRTLNKSQYRNVIKLNKRQYCNVLVTQR